MALGLYRDHELVRECLQRSSAPEDAPRVAFSLDDPVEGPFVIVARDGAFVTCLGRGMRAKHPVIPREELEMIATHIDGLREALSILKQDSTQETLLMRVMTRGELLFAEDLAELRAVLPLIEARAMRSVIELGQALTQALPRVRRDLKRKGAKSRAKVAQYSRLLWRYRTHMVVAGLASPRVRATLLDSDYSLSEPAMRVELQLLVVVGAWLTAQFGPEMIDTIVGRVNASEDIYSRLDGVVGLCAVAARHPEERARVRHVFEHELDFPEGLRAIPGAAIGMIELDEEGRLDDILVKEAREILARAGMAPAEGSGVIAPAEALTWMFQIGYNVLETPDAFLRALTNSMAAAKLEAEALCLPRRCSGYQEAFLLPSAARHLIKEIRQERTVPRPVLAEPIPGRNDLCPCGSGKKYKRCCGGAA